MFATVRSGTSRLAVVTPTSQRQLRLTIGLVGKARRRKAYNMVRKDDSRWEARGADGRERTRCASWLMLTCNETVNTVQGELQLVRVIMLASWLRGKSLEPDKVLAPTTSFVEGNTCTYRKTRLFLLRRDVFLQLAHSLPSASLV